MFRILVVCVGNICRSPMAVALLQRELAGRDVHIESAGLAAMVGHPIDPQAAAELRTHGLSLDAHIASQISADRIQRADLILAMERRHIAALLAMQPKARKKISLMGKWHGDVEVADPYGRKPEAFAAAYDALETAASSWKARIK